MLPLAFLAVMLTLTGVALAMHAFLRQHRTRALRGLAREWRMHYSPGDPFQLLPKVVEHFPVPGAADLCLADLIYCQRTHCYRYLLTVQYTHGVLRGKKRTQRAVAFIEPRERAGACDVVLHLAPAELPLLQQYVALREAMTADEKTPV